MIALIHGNPFNIRSGLSTDDVPKLGPTTLLELFDITETLLAIYAATQTRTSFEAWLLTDMSLIGSYDTTKWWRG